jgi:hypothetical protein
MLDHVASGLVMALQQLLLVLGPLFLLAWVLQQLSRYIRNRIAWTFHVDAYTYLTAPGVVIHELGHAFFCVIFGHRIVRMNLFRPQPDGTLGFVQHSYNPKSLYQQFGNFFIGTGPIWFGTAIVYALSRFVLGSSLPHGGVSIATGDAAGSLAHTPALLAAVLDASWQVFLSMLHWPAISGWALALVFYLIFCIGSHITLSRPDIDGAAKGFALLVGVLLIADWAVLLTGPGIASRFNDWLLDYLVVVYGSCLFIVLVNLVLAGGIFLLYRAGRAIRP